MTDWIGSPDDDKRLEEVDDSLMEGTEYYGPDVTDGQGPDFTVNLEPAFWEADQIEGGRVTTVFGELLQTGWDWGRNTWTSTTMAPEVLAIVRPRLNKKIERRYMLRELSIEMPGRWKLLFNARLEDLVDLYGPQYNEIAKGLDLSGISESKSRSVNSEYPQAQLQPVTQDYASDANETGSEAVSSASTLEAFRLYESFFKHPDEKIVEALDDMFSHFPYWLNDLTDNYN